MTYRDPDPTIAVTIGILAAAVIVIALLLAAVNARVEALDAELRRCEALVEHDPTACLPPEASP